MILTLLIHLGCAMSVATTSPDFRAVLLAGSSGLANYRHQADVCHSYQLLACTLSSSSVSVLMFDDVVWTNPIVGKLFNQPNGRDVYANCEIAVRGFGVSKKNFDEILAQTADPHATLFVSFVDHGGVGELLFPNGESMTGLQWLATIRSLRFARLLMYVEACFAGSVFEDLPLPANVLIVTASNATESSWGTFCPTPLHPDADSINGVHIGTCLGDLFSVVWMVDLERRARVTNQSSTLGDHIRWVQQTVSSKSSVTLYGDLSLLDLPLFSVFPSPRVVEGGEVGASLPDDARDPFISLLLDSALRTAAFLPEAAVFLPESTSLVLL